MLLDGCAGRRLGTRSLLFGVGWGSDGRGG